MQKVVGIMFILSWLLCGCTIDTFFDGGAPVFITALIVAVICAAVLGSSEDLKGPTGEWQLSTGTA